jgi:hypothetical protein
VKRGGSASTGLPCAVVPANRRVAAHLGVDGDLQRQERLRVASDQHAQRRADEPPHHGAHVPTGMSGGKRARAVDRRPPRP